MGSPPRALAPKKRYTENGGLWIKEYKHLDKMERHFIYKTKGFMIVSVAQTRQIMYNTKNVHQLSLYTGKIIMTTIIHFSQSLTLITMQGYEFQ